MSTPTFDPMKQRADLLNHIRKMGKEVGGALMANTFLMGLIVSREDGELKHIRLEELRLLENLLEQIDRETLKKEQAALDAAFDAQSWRVCHDLAAI